jgi:NADH-quinone oxidoreductase subunit C
MQANISNPSAKFKTAAVEELKNRVEEKLKARFGDALISSSIDYDFPVFNVKREAIIEVMEHLYHESDLSFQFLTTLATSHKPENKGAEFEMMYQLHSLTNNYRIRLKTTLPTENPTVRTATTLFASANWQERQEFDFFGVIFEGHPNLKRILNMDEMNYHPMRKEYALEDAQREDKDNSFFGR